MYMCVVLYMDLPSGRKKLRLGKLKSKFFKDFSQNQCMYAHTLQDHVPTVDLRTPEENETTQHNVYTLTILHKPHTIHSVYIHKAELFSTVSFVYTQILWNAEDE